MGWRVRVTRCWSGRLSLTVWVMRLGWQLILPCWCPTHSQTLTIYAHHVAKKVLVKSTFLDNFQRSEASHDFVEVSITGLSRSRMTESDVATI